MRILHQWDLILGTVGTGVTFSLATVNAALGCAVGLLTIAVMTLRLAREWRDRHKHPKD